MTDRNKLMDAYARIGVRGMIAEGVFDTLASGSPSKPLSREFAIYGDSRTAQCHTVAATAISTENYGYAFWAAQKSGGFCPSTFNFGVGGDTTAMMLSRISSVVSNAADIVLFLGSTNDRTGGFSVADTKRNITAIVRRLQKAGKIVIVGNETPRFGGNALDEDQQYDHEQIRDWITDELSLITPVADTYSLITALDLHDGLHPNVKGANKIGTAFGDVLSKYITFGVDLPVESRDQYDASMNVTGGLTINPLMTGSSTQSTGSVNPVAGSVVASGYKGAGSSFTGVTTKWSKEDFEYGQKQVIEFGGTATTAGAYIAISPTATFNLSNIQAGNVISLMCGYDLIGDGTGILSVTAELLVTKPVSTVSTVIYHRDGDKYQDPWTMPSGVISGALDTPRYTVDGTETAIGVRISVYLAQNVPLTSVLKLYQFAVRKHIS